MNMGFIDMDMFPKQHFFAKSVCVCIIVLVGLIALSYSSLQPTMIETRSAYLSAHCWESAGTYAETVITSDGIEKYSEILALSTHKKPSIRMSLVSCLLRNYLKNDDRKLLEIVHVIINNERDENTKKNMQYALEHCCPNELPRATTTRIHP